MAFKITGRIAKVERVEFTNQQTGELVAFDRIHLFDGLKTHQLRVPEGLVYEVDQDLLALMDDTGSLVEIPVEAREYKGVTTFRHVVPESASPRPRV